MKASAAKLSHMALTPTSPRTTWPSGWRVTSALVIRRFHSSQITSGMRPKALRANTTCPLGTSSATKRTSADMMAKKNVELICRAMPAGAFMRKIRWVDVI